MYDMKTCQRWEIAAPHILNHGTRIKCFALRLDNLSSGEESTVPSEQQTEWVPYPVRKLLEAKFFLPLPGIEPRIVQTVTY
jgi:hypothetical protein